MDLIKIIRELQQERDKVDTIIRSLEQLDAGTAPAKTVTASGRRGRRFMDAEDRREVSARMKKYWEDRRNRQESENAAHSASTEGKGAMRALSA